MRTASTGTVPVAAVPVVGTAPVVTAPAAPLPAAPAGGPEPAGENTSQGWFGQVVLAVLGQRIAADPNRLIEFAERLLAHGITPKATGRLVRQIARPAIGPLIVLVTPAIVVALSVAVSSVAVALITRSALWSSIPVTGAGLAGGVWAYRRSSRQRTPR